jgi:hypothetical protein
MPAASASVGTEDGRQFVALRSVQSKARVVRDPNRSAGKFEPGWDFGPASGRRRRRICRGCFVDFATSSLSRVRADAEGQSIRGAVAAGNGGWRLLVSSGPAGSACWWFATEAPRGDALPNGEETRPDREITAEGGAREAAFAGLPGEAVDVSRGARDSACRMPGAELVWMLCVSNALRVAPKVTVVVTPSRWSPNANGIVRLFPACVSRAAVGIDDSSSEPPGEAGDR